MQYLLPTGDTITYPALIAALAKPGEAIIETLTGDMAHAWHMASCIPGEAGELFAAFNPAVCPDDVADRENAIEELGDIEFYAEGLRQVLGITREDTALAATAANVGLYDLPLFAAEVFDATKKWVIYGKDVDVPAIARALGNLDAVLGTLRRVLCLTLSETLAPNVMKLGKRYASMGYSDAQAQIRADKVN